MNGEQDFPGGPQAEAAAGPPPGDGDPWERMYAVAVKSRELAERLWHDHRAGKLSVPAMTAEAKQAATAMFFIEAHRQRLDPPPLPVKP